MSQEQLSDALIIGGGPAGLAAAMALGRACRSVVLFDSQEYRNEAAPTMHNVLCNDGNKPELFRATAMEEMMCKYDSLTFVDTQITGARLVTKGTKTIFEITNHKGLVWFGRKLILASGTKDILPCIPGYKELWGRGVLHCLFCEGFERKGGHFGILGLRNQDDLTALSMSFRLADDGVTVFTNAEGISDDPEVQQIFRIAASCGATFDHRRIESMSEHPNGDGIQLHFQDGSQRALRLLLSTPPSVNRAVELISNLKIDVHPPPEGHVSSKGPLGETNIRGCFVAGDTSTSAKIVNVAMASGSLAGIGVAIQLASDEALETLGANPEGQSESKI